MLADTRETGFVNAITAAGVTYAVTRACTMGDLVECSCEKMSPKSKCAPFCSSYTYTDFRVLLCWDLEGSKKIIDWLIRYNCFAYF